MVGDELWEAYARTIVSVQMPDGRWLEGAEFAAGIDRPAYVLTAWNPGELRPSTRKSSHTPGRPGGMKTQTQSLPFQLGEPRSHRGLALFPLHPAEAPVAEYVGLDEAVARGLSIREVDEASNVQLARVL
jgi:hypothetical protein